MGFIIGARGLIHLTWAAPWAVLLLFVGYGIITRMMQKSLNEMFDKIDSLSSGDVDLVFNEKFLKGGHELARVIRRISKLADSLKNIVVFANHVGKGELNVEYTLLSEKDTLGKAMLDMQANLQKAEVEKDERQREDERRNWVTIGVAKFAELLRDNNDNIEELCHSIISNLVKYIGANQAGIFILNDDNTEHPVLELKACYAYERRKYLQKTIELGEGLVGTCYLERQSIYMTHLPKDYIHITSGLGDDTPRALLIAPLKVNEEIYGIVEIAAFKEFEPHVRDFVEKVAESIASTIGSVKVNLRTTKLLEISKVQSEEMAGQEEELRQNMEEMQATQEEMARKQAENETLHKKLNAENIDLVARLRRFEQAVPSFVLSTDLNVKDVSDSLLSQLPYSKSELTGRKIIDFVVDGKDDFEEMLNGQVLNGETVSGTIGFQHGQKVCFCALPLQSSGAVTQILLMCIASS
ncbi:MAG: GAF domain-containing protein [Bacteroidales bacterium]|nr:GAF domain-containing protein [Bacteroidales bacterium]